MVYNILTALTLIKNNSNHIDIKKIDIRKYVENIIKILIIRKEQL